MWKYIGHIDLHSITSSSSISRNKESYLNNLIKTEALKTAEGKTMALCSPFLTEKVMGMRMV